MCGIAGIVRYSPPAPDTRPRLAAALRAQALAIAHRGPDGAGTYTDPRPDSTASLTHSRLAIIDLPGGTQPMPNEDGTVHVVFNGEIYNHQELRAELQALGHRFHTDHSDTEVLVHGFEQWGEELPARLLGMFAFAVYDAPQNTLFLARDRLGQKPLFYAPLDDGLVFGSTIPAVLACPDVPRRASMDQIGLYLLLGFVPPALGTVYRAVQQVAPGCWLRQRGPVLDGRRYFSAPVCDPDPHLKYAPPAPAELAAELRATLGAAVASQLIADVPIACFLSGGLDSSIIATLMQQAVRAAGGPRIHTVSVGFAEAAYDETAFAQRVADHLGTDHTRLEVNLSENVLVTLGRLIRRDLGHPFADSSLLPTHALAQAVRQVAPVALSGDGGDELFGGYDRYRGLALLREWSWLLRNIPLGVSGHERLRRLLFAARGQDEAEQYTRLLAIFGPELERLLGTLPDYAPTREDFGIPPTASARRYAMGRDQQEYLPGDVLWKVDAASMAVPLEVRSPLLDHRVVAFANSRWTRDHFTGLRGKRLLRAAFARELPAAILSRGKQGFALPIGQWFRTSLLTPLREIILARDGFVSQHLRRAAAEQLLLEHATGQRDHTHRLFALLTLQMWFAESGATVD